MMKSVIALHLCLARMTFVSGCKKSDPVGLTEWRSWFELLKDMQPTTEKME
jgi:hypothetical protein